MKKWILMIVFLLSTSFPTVLQAAEKKSCDVIEKVFKDAKVEGENGICTVEIVRTNLNVTHMGMKLSPETMELVFHFALENVGNETAVMGELALLEDEVNPVIDQLREGNLEVSAIHNHMIHENPRIFYVHFQGIGDLTLQAEIIKKAINNTK
ncbi:DUF1259 domain-containing protein [Litchfieldia alkalitelluris]|uniref:DUF1259 domain-containing protein n=1 Tax=Litchfieldia alkalitelluris TaxID=304268 RepID=UPI000998DFC2|nr:DUF1259 domain-containing protein [Litchfieldia alkalitelluris]